VVFGEHVQPLLITAAEDVHQDTDCPAPDLFIYLNVTNTDEYARGFKLIICCNQVQLPIKSVLWKLIIFPLCQGKCVDAEAVVVYFILLHCSLIFLRPSPSAEAAQSVASGYENWSSYFSSNLTTKYLCLYR